MRQFMIGYTFALDPEAQAAWHRRVAEFIEELGADPDLAGRIRYRCMKAKQGAAYYHLAEPADEEAIRVLNTRAYFMEYTAETKRVGGSSVFVTELDLLADSAAG